MKTMIDFLVPERGKGTDRPYPIKPLGENDQPLRFLDLLNCGKVLFERVRL